AAPIRSCSRWGLPCRLCYQRRGALLPHPFTLTLLRQGYGGRFAFCCTVPGVAPAGGYPAPCFLEPGLSSPPYAERPSGLLTTVIRGFGEVPSSAEGFDCRAFLPAGLPARNGILIASLPYIPIS